jgi:hypothetical protein
MLNVTQSVENLFITIHIFLLVSVLGLVHTLCVLFLRAITRVRVLLLRPRACSVLLLVTRIRTILLLVTRIRTVLLSAARIHTILLLVTRIRTVLLLPARICTILLLVTRIRTVLLLDVGIRTVLFLVARIGSVPLLVARVRALPTSVTRISIHFEVGEERGVGGWLVQVVVVRRAGSGFFVGVDDQHRRRLSLRHRSIHFCLLLPEAALPQSAKHQNCPTDEHPQHEIAPRSVFREHLRNRVRRFGRPLRRVSLGGGGGGGTWKISINPLDHLPQNYSLSVLVSSFQSLQLKKVLFGGCDVACCSSFSWSHLLLASSGGFHFLKSSTASCSKDVGAKKLFLQSLSSSSLVVELLGQLGKPLQVRCRRRTSWGPTRSSCTCADPVLCTLDLFGCH